MDYLLEQHIRDEKSPLNICILKESRVPDGFPLKHTSFVVCLLMSVRKKKEKKKEVNKFAHLPSRRHLMNTSGFIVLFRSHNFQVTPLHVHTNGTRILMFC